MNPLKYHEKIRNEQHVFLFAVSGRSSSTAFQRIINSSNKVWMWGEPHGIIGNLHYLTLCIKSFMESQPVNEALNLMYHSYLDNKHLSFYANAIGNLKSSVELLNSGVSNFLKPWASNIRRFGFKEIEFVPIELIEHLKELYPNCIFIFCFRNPLSQWPSLRKLTLNVSSDLDVFLEAYEKMASAYIRFANKQGINAFVENEDLRDGIKIKTIIQYLNLPKIDNSLIDVTVHSMENKKKLTKSEVVKIMESPAYGCYLQMQKISQSFYK
ncbi:hypothetical protein [Mucilaginibacter galii]|nr:hypothetical protein [Mucilaginibacter galii]